MNVLVFRTEIYFTVYGTFADLGMGERIPGGILTFDGCDRRDLTFSFSIDMV